MSNEINFTKDALSNLALPAPGKRDTYHDKKTTGLQVRVTASGVKTFSFYRRIKGGQPERVTLGRFPDMSIEQARRKTAELNSSVENGDNPAELKRVLKGEPTFADIFNEYLERHAKIKKITWQEDVRQYSRYLEKSLGPKKVSTIDRKMIATLHNDLTRKGRSTTANRIKALISIVFNKGIEFGLVTSNPADGVKNNPETSRDRFIQSNELEPFFNAMNEEPNETVRDFFWVALLTGARRANVLSMRWSDISITESTWRIPLTKNGTPQLVALGEEVIQILDARKNLPDTDATFVFPGTGATAHLVEPKKGWARILARAGISNLRIHDLRRTLGSWQAKTGASLPIIGKSLNHKSPQTTVIYARLDMDPARASVKKATAAMLNVGGVSFEGNANESDNKSGDDR